MSARPVIGLRDSNFSPGDLDDDRSFVWDRTEAEHDVMVFTDKRLAEAADSTAAVKCAWLIEPPAVKPEPYEFVRAHLDDFDHVFTFVKGMQELGPQVRWYPFAGCWVPDADFRVHEKTADVSIIASDKQNTDGQRMRHVAIARFGDSLDGVFGPWYAPLPPKEGKVAGLAPFRYSIAVENSVLSDYFTEKIVDCFATGTVPLYWGSPDVVEHFDPGGIVFFSGVDELEALLDDLGPEDYARRLPAIERNLEAARGFTSYNENLWRWALADVWAGLGEQG